MIPSPFAPPVDVARRAALALRERLAPWRGLLDAPGGGKMFGVLVVEGGEVLHAFSGMLGGRWVVPGFAPPVFDLAARDAFWPAGEAELATLDPARKAARSRELLAQIHDCYVIANARGETRRLRELYAPAEPPGGAGDCAAPKLIAWAYALGKTPVALAEVWCGAPPLAGGRVDGGFYPACRGKCGPLLPWQLDGLDVEPAPIFGDAPVPPDEPRVVLEDDWLVIVDKPVGLLSVPGRHARLRDSVEVRLRRRYPDAKLAHRLDLDTSGLLVVAKDEPTYVAVQRLFARREIDKRYVAVLDGDVRGDHGTIELALRVDVDDRPRQIHDPVYGKPAITTWRVLSRGDGRTRVALTPHTGRSHQLRVHAAHALGLGVPIVGDRLYGTSDDRLHLHAEALAFVHPVTGATIALERPAPF